MSFLSDNFKAVAKTFAGIEPALAGELAENGYEKIEQHNRAVSFVTDLEGLYKANFLLRSALHVLVPLASGEISDGKELYELAYAIEWDKIFKTTDTFAVASSVKSNLYKHSNYPALLVKDAVADKFREKLGGRPYVAKNNPDVVITVHVFGNKAEILLDSSGESLHKRGYRLEKVSAPLNETLAAGLILLSGWDKKTTFIDPMCGSGTLAIEAALIANNIPPNLQKKKFAFKNWKNFDLQLFTKTKNSLKRKILNSETRIIANDISAEAIKIALNNAVRAKAEEKIEFNEISFFKYLPPEGKKFVIFNPPYDQRIKLQDTVRFYREIGDTLKRNYQNSVVWIFSGNKQAIKKIGLSSSRKFTMLNGAIESYFRKFEIYEGSKKKKTTLED